MMLRTTMLTAAAMLIQLGCDGNNPAGPSNKRPVVGDISDMMLERGDSATVSVQVTDADVGDNHTINASCEDPGIARASTEDKSVTITALDGGETTCSVYATDSSGQGNARSKKVTFQVTVPRNNQPVVEDISDVRLEFRSSSTVSVQVTDADSGDEHTINASCGNSNIATAIARGEIITLNAEGVGQTTCTVYVTDSSGQSNAQSEKVTFRVTVPEPPPVHLGNCRVGMDLDAGESCNYYSDGFTVKFSVKADGSACRASNKTVTKVIFGRQVTIEIGEACVTHDIKGDDVYDEPAFSADNNSDGTWTIRDIP